MKDAYKDIIQFALDGNRLVPQNFKEVDWQDFYKFCLSHSIHGIVLDGIERADFRVPKTVVLEWIGSVEYLKHQNALVNKRLLAVSKWWEEQGYKSVILKGQANGLMYPRPELRCPGDIDIWVDGEKIDIIKTVLSRFPGSHYSIHHIKMPVFHDVSVEVHYRPIYLTNWFIDKKLQHYIADIEKRQFDHKEELDGHEIGCLTDAFNVIYQLLHMYAHFFSTRNNFKQLIDYYFLLKRGLDEDGKNRVNGLLKEFRMEKYAQGIMWIMLKVLGLDRDLLITEPDEKIGKAILREALKYGTFSSNKFASTIGHFVANLRLATMFPSEVFVSPLFLLWHQWWKLKTRFEVQKAVE